MIDTDAMMQALQAPQLKIGDKVYTGHHLKYREAMQYMADLQGSVGDPAQNLAVIEQIARAMGYDEAAVGQLGNLAVPVLREVAAGFFTSPEATT